MKTYFRITSVIILFIISGASNSVFAQPVPASYLTGLPFSLPVIQMPTFPDRAINIIAHGAIADGQTMNTKAINDAIQECAKAGGGRVTVPAGVWLTGPIRFENNIDLHLEAGAIIMFSRNRDDFPLVPYPTPASKNLICANPIYGYGLENIAITGDGIIDGSGEVWRPMKKEKYTANQWKKTISTGGVVTEDGKMWWPSQQALQGEAYLKALRKEKKVLSKEDFTGAKDFLRPNLVVFHSCKKVLFDGPTFRNSPKFCVNPVQCENLVIRNIKIQNDWSAQNGDGLDIGSSHNVVVYNCEVDAGDDAICLKSGAVDKEKGWIAACENIVIADCIVYHGHGGFVIGSETYGGTRNISVRNCIFIGTDVGLRFKSSRNRGGLTENIYIDGIQMKNIVNEAILFDMYYEDDKPANGEVRKSMPVTERTPQFQKFYVKNIICNGASQAIFVQGLPEQFARDIELTNITISATKGVTCIDAEGLQFNNVRILLEQGPVFDIDNARDITITHPSYSAGADLFMKIVGKESENIKLLDADIKSAKKDFDLGKDVSPKVIIQK
ncbi:MAG: glycoside hydrolase family 28 protein [Bacteroidota bacterium]|jgi:DNA sulfur modification protein DndE